MAADDRYLADNRRLWNEWTAIHVTGDFYHVETFRNGDNRIRAWERAEVGDVAGKRLLHLQCHFGLDTLSWARLGADVTGVDFSPAAIAEARALAQDVGIVARFLESELSALPAVLNETFDIVYTSRGVLGWLPSIDRWAEIATSYVRPGGFLFVHEIHPVIQALDEDRSSATELALGYGYREGGVLSFQVQGSYADPHAQLTSTVEHGWNHGLGEIVTAIVSRGLRLDFLHEHDELDWSLPFLVQGSDGRWRWPADAPGSLPLMFSLRATRPTEADRPG